MIDLNTIRDVKVLEEMKKDLTLFITDPIILEIYKEDYDFGEEDYKDDKDQAEYLLGQVEKRIKGLNQSLSKRTANRNKKSVKKENTSTQ